MQSPTLLYDGDCGFCRYWVDYWQRLTGASVVYAPYQQALHRFPQLTAAECRRSIQLITPDLEILAGPAAAYRVLARGGHSNWQWLYAHFRLFAVFSAWAYDFIARHRTLAFRGAHLLWGKQRHPADFHLASWWFLRVICLIYIAAFASLGVQIDALVGSHGILPLSNYFEAVHDALGNAAFYQLPSLFWFDTSDVALIVACCAGVIIALVACSGYGVPIMLGLCYGLYLSLLYAGQEFMTFQWDLLLLEAGFLAMLLPSGKPFVPFLFRCLLFKFMFLSGAVKLLSGDPSWASLSALDFHYETQPLPTALAWYMHQLPRGFNHFCVAMTLFVELCLPFLIFLPRNPRLLAAAGFIALQGMIALTGNYNFFNLLTASLCLFLFDDKQLMGLTPRRIVADLRRPADATRRGFRVLLPAAGTIILCLSLYHIVNLFYPRSVPDFARRARSALDPLHLSNSYGLFAVMTTTRPEIIIEGSRDGHTWLAYEFRYKPGALERVPGWNIPHQPRLDWQLWFAALESADRNPWFTNLLVRLLQNSPVVTSLLAYDPFPLEPPQYVRALLYTYRYSKPAVREATGAWWTRRLEGLYYPAIRLRVSAVTR